ncbi:MAG TPA: hemolysin family protein [Rhizomicrobium sp.]|jgi:CBS domain containing-hemolysin-like protein|nr:hemolysin family protein [Rhizomicrobium sp.]
MSDHNHKGEPSAGNGRHTSLLERLSHLLGRGHAHAMRESLEEVIEESDRQNTDLSPQERRMLANLLKFGELRVGDVMVPRADIVAIEEQASLKELIETLRAEQHSRLPVYRETLDDPIGLVHVKDVLSLVEIGGDGAIRWPDVAISKIRRNLLFVPASMPVLDLLLKMQTSHMHLALVIDEYGGTDGLVTIEDLVEEIVGDIDDEHDIAEAPQLRALPDGGWEADARMDLDDFREQTGLDLEPTDPNEEVDTLGGLVVALLGRLPQRGEIVRHPSGLELQVLEADPRRVKRLRLRQPQSVAKPATPA